MSHLSMWLLTAPIPLLSAWAAFRQKADEVAVREPGHRSLGTPFPVAGEARKHWQYAALAEASYRRTPKGSKADGETSECPPVVAVLEAHGWELWDFPNDKLDDGLLTKISEFHLRVEVWEHPETNSVVVSFGGTVFKNGNDWRANLRWFTPHHKDEYTEIVRVFGPAFLDEMRRRLALSDGARLKNVNLYATGHSLGGGLAQQFAYSLPLNELGLRVKHVYAFDPSPVTGFFSVDTKTRDVNRVGLLIDRIYERGEILALLRSLTSFFWKPSAVNAAIRGVRYDLFYTINSVAGHSMVHLACQLRIAAGEPPFRQGASGSK